MPDTIFLSTAELAERWRMSQSALRFRRMKGLGPTYHMLDGSARYALADVEAYEKANRVKPIEPETGQ